MHWKREAEWAGIGERLEAQLTDLVNKAALELRGRDKQDESWEEAIEALRKRLEAPGN
jgi:hypothetical protein